MTQNELILYVKDRIKTIAPGDEKISGALLQDVILSIIVNMPSTTGDSNLATKAFTFTNDDLDGSFAIIFEHNLSTVIPGIMVFNHMGEPIGEAHYTSAVVDANNASLTFYEALPAGATYKVVFVYYLSDVPLPEDDYIEYFEESFSLFTGEQYRETPYGWSTVNTIGETFGADFAIEEDNGALKITLSRASLPGDTGTLWQVGLSHSKMLKAGETYRFTADLKCSDPNGTYFMFIGVVNTDDSNQFTNAASPSPITAAWQEFTEDFTPLVDGNLKIVYKFYSSWDKPDIYIDNLKIEKIS